MTKPLLADDETLWPKWRNGVPDELNDLLWEEALGPYNRNFRLHVRQWWLGMRDEVPSQNPQQAAAMEKARALAVRLTKKA